MPGDGVGAAGDVRVVRMDRKIERFFGRAEGNTK